MKFADERLDSQPDDEEQGSTRRQSTSGSNGGGRAEASQERPIDQSESNLIEDEDEMSFEHPPTTVNAVTSGHHSRAITEETKGTPIINQ